MTRLNFKSDERYIVRKLNDLNILSSKFFPVSNHSVTKWMSNLNSSPRTFFTGLYLSVGLLALVIFATANNLKSDRNFVVRN